MVKRHVQKFPTHASFPQKQRQGKKQGEVLGFEDREESLTNLGMEVIGE
jgi:hypothetical protein